MSKISYYLPFLLILLCSFSQSSRQMIDLSGKGWTLWQDKDAHWQTERIFMHPINPELLFAPSPTKGWEVLTAAEALPVAVPGTAEQYLQTVSGPDGDIQGVTWWTRTIQLPTWKGEKRILLKFESIRSRAEIFINQQLVGYEIVDSTPFEIDITPHVKSGETVQLAVRITDAGGNYDWRDSKVITWGEHTLPPGHAFGGITGKVGIEICPPIYTADIYMQNTPQPNVAKALLAINNSQAKVVKKDLLLTVSEWNNRSNIIFRKEMTGIPLQSGLNEITLQIDAPEAKLWDVDNPHLYICSVELTEHSDTRDTQKASNRTTQRTVDDYASQRFGFRWFEATGIGKDAVFRLNGKRIVLRSAISWGFWPVNGIFPTDELAERQIRVAKELGLNMLNFHRFIGSTNVLNYADELGLLYFEEPGGFRIQPGNGFLNANLHQKTIRMVKRDRSHPSLVIFNLMNESGDATPEKLAIELQTMKAIQQLDPSRYILRTSAWAKADDINDQAKIHIRPNDTTIYWKGWYDYHHAGGPAVWNEALYLNPQKYYNNTTNSREIVFFGEEGALSSPPRLEKNKAELDRLTYKGWDGGEFLRWYDEFSRFLDEKKLRSFYPTVDSLTVAMGTVSFEHQGRKIESARMNNYTDAYVVNGWESELIENYSGIVDCFRYPKSNPAIIARYNQPLYVAVKTRQQVAEAGEKAIADFYLINEKGVRGNYQLHLSISDSQGKETFITKKEVTVSGGEVYGELLLSGVELPIPTTGGLCCISASLFDEKEKVITSGHDEILAVNLSSNILGGKGAVWEDGKAIQNFLQGKTQEPIVAYTDQTGKLDWVIVSRPPNKEQLTMVPSEALRASDGSNGLTATYFKDLDFKEKAHSEVAKVVNLSAIEGATPHPLVPAISNYSIIWDGTVIPPVSGEYTFIPQSNDRSLIELYIDGKKIYEILQDRTHRGTGKILLSEGKEVNIEIRFKHPRSNARCRLDWAVPNNRMPNPQQLMERAHKDGTKVIILENADEWSPYIAANSQAIFKDKFFVGTNWLGGVMFNKSHPVFNELPSSGALNWPYQALIHTGVERMGLVMSGEELLVGAYHTYPMALGTAMGIVPVGKGSVLFSTLDIYGNIVNESTAGLVAKKIVLNMIDLK